MPHRGGVPRRRRQARELAVGSACVVLKALVLTTCRRSVRTSWRGAPAAIFRCGWTIPRLDSPLCCNATGAAPSVSAHSCLCVRCSNVRYFQEILPSCAISAALWYISSRPRTSNKRIATNALLAHSTASQVSGLPPSLCGWSNWLGATTCASGAPELML